MAFRFRYTVKWKNTLHENDDTDKIVGNIIDESVLAKVKPWYFANGQLYPKPVQINSKTHKRNAKLLPSEDPWNDRITNQLMFIPPNYDEIVKSGKLKTILLFNGLSAWNVGEGRELFNKCPVNTCRVTENRETANEAELILYKDIFRPMGVSRPSYQLYMLYRLESPFHTYAIDPPDVFNWTATYR